MEKDSIALIDGDLLPYEFGSMVQLEEPDQPLPWEILRKLVDDRVEWILSATKASEYKMFLTESSANFRLSVATILPYKGHRKAEKPYHWQNIRQHLIDNWDAAVIVGWEADDALSYLQESPYPDSRTVICSRDKDLDMVPGRHYSWGVGNNPDSTYFIDYVEGLRNFYKQLLTGDRTDNILGLYGVGEKSTLVKKIDELEEEQDMFNLVRKAYDDRFGAYSEQFLRETAALLWMLRDVPDPTVCPSVEINLRLDGLYDKRD